MVWEAWFTAGLVVAMFGLLAFTRAAPDFVFVGAAILLMVTGVIGPAEAFVGFSNQGVITVGALYVVVAGIRETGGIQWIVHNLLGRPGSLVRAQWRLAAPVSGGEHPAGGRSREIDGGCRLDRADRLHFPVPHRAADGA
jgi:hypothetical protein